MNNLVQLDPPMNFDDLSSLLSSILWGCVLVGIVGTLAGGSLVFKAYSHDDPHRARTGFAAMIGGIVVAAASGLVRLVVLPSSDAPDDAPSEPVSAAPTTVEAPAPIDTTTPVDTTTAPTDWTPLLWAGAVLAALVALAVLVHLGVRTRSHLTDRKKAQATLEADFATASTVYAEVAAAYADYLADIYAIFERPLLDDTREPRTAAFIDAFAGATALKTDTCPATPERVQAFADAARAAHKAWESADEHARAIGMGTLDTAGQRTVRHIKSALAIAVDDAAAPGERDTALDTVRRLSAGLITIPDRVYARAKTAIETTTRKQLTR